MITTIPDRERDLQAQVDALTEELERLRAQEPVALKSVHLIRDVQGMCAKLSVALGLSVQAMAAAAMSQAMRATPKGGA